MTVQEFSQQFDLLYNNITSNQAPGMNEYEKSVFLTQAQDAFVLDNYRGSSSPSFEVTEEVTEYLSNLVKTGTLVLEPEESSGSSRIHYAYKAELPKDLWLITQETATMKQVSARCPELMEVPVVPIRQDEYSRVINNPFRGPNERRVIQLREGSTVILLSKFELDKVSLKYLSEPEPIILEDLTSYNVSIKGKTAVTECKLNPITHMLILNLAVQLAKTVWEDGTK